TPNAVAITAGLNGTLDTAPVADDGVSGDTITTGPDGICNTTAAGDDVQVIPVGQGQAGQTCVGQGVNAFRDTPNGDVLGDDVVSGADVTTGPDGVCNTTANGNRSRPGAD
ncbi:MAG: hypothetical protein IIC51_04610, partial [Planctomycetes bacterium]|nr:hypothetical protein [Planctomycetota bacterium]